MLYATPIALGPVSLKNRFVMSAMGSGLGDPSGAPNERLIRYLEARAEADVAMIIVEATGVMATLRYTPRQPSLAVDSLLPSWRELARRIHRQGAKIAVQLQHPGRQTLDQSDGEPVAPSPIGTRHGGPAPRALSVGEIEEIVASFGSAAARARAAGLDAAELHAGHGYLFTQFLSPAANHRDDAYGGSLENRFRFLQQVVRSIQSAAGEDYPIIARLSFDEFVDGGATLEESLRVAHWLKELGIVALRVSGGSNDQRIPVMIPPTDAPRGIFWEHSKIVRTEVGLPVDAAARIQTAELAERLLREGFADFISLGRPLLADPGFVRKALATSSAATRPCIACNQGCIDRILDRRIGMITCLVNPEVGREHEALLDQPRPTPRKVMIAGAGPAGIEAALVARLLGHDVRLFEVGPTLGGEFAYAHRPPGKEDFASFLPFCQEELRRLDVDVQMNTSVDEMLIAAQDADILIWAAGAYRRPPFAESPVRQCSVTDLYRDGIPSGRSAVVLGTSWEGAETALALAAAGIEVTCLEPQSKFGGRLSPVTRRWYVRQRAGEAGIRIACGVRDLSVAAGQVRWSADDGEHSTVCDFIVYEGTRVPRPAPATPAGLRLLTIGDAAQPASAFEAIRSGFDTALTIQ
jgi:2,4-dienoyl-CoA reductase-like NADH-dependent reductase (Old Yellow Enzyme family)